MDSQPGESGERESGSRLSGKMLDLVSAVLLGVAAVATSWIGYQSSQWSDEKSSCVNQSAILRLQANRSASETAVLQLVDVGSFTSWVNAYGSGNEVLEAFYRKRFREEFRPAFEAWIAQKPLKNPNAASSPFAMPEYSPASRLETRQLEALAVEKDRAARKADATEDRYIMGTVLLAVALFFSGIARQFPRLAMQAVMLGFAALLCLVVLALVIRQPIIFL